MEKTKIRPVVLLCVIYGVFSCVGLPSTLLGTAWPIMYRDLDLSLYYAGIFQMVITGGTILATLLSGMMIRRLGFGRSNITSLMLIALGLLGFSLLPSFRLLFLCAFIQGYGTGVLDAGINNFVALHYKARYMNWLHCFYGIGAALSPLIMSYFISREEQWRSGYFSVSMVCWAFVFLLLVSLPLWKPAGSGEPITEGPPAKRINVLRIPGVTMSFLSFFGAGSIIGMIQVWGSTYLVLRKDLLPDRAAGWVSLFFILLTVGRLIAGIINGAFSNRIILRSGCLFIILGLLCLLLPWPLFSLISFICLGFGAAPIVPAIVHENPRRFGAANSQAIVGYQFAASYFGMFAVPILGGLLISNISMALFPFILIFFAIFLTVSVREIP
jgi:fucose permease